MKFYVLDVGHGFTKSEKIKLFNVGKNEKVIGVDVKVIS